MFGYEHGRNIDIALFQCLLNGTPVTQPVFRIPARFIGKCREQVNVEATSLALFVKEIMWTVFGCAAKDDRSGIGSHREW